MTTDCRCSLSVHCALFNVYKPNFLPEVIPSGGLNLKRAVELSIQSYAIGNTNS